MRRLHRIVLLLLPMLFAACSEEGGAPRQVSDERAYADDGSTTNAPALAREPAPGTAVSGEEGVQDGGDQDAAGADQSAAVPADPTAPPMVQPGPVAADTASPAGAAQTDAAAPRMIIRTGNATVEVDSLEPAIARVQRLAQQVGGYVANTQMQAGRENAREATLELKIPAARWEQAVAGLRPLGELESLTVSSQDVGEEYVDVTARMNNARRLEQRLVELLATRTGRLEDVLSVERELARVREQIERYEGRLRYLRTRVAVSTLTVRLHEPIPVIGGRPGGNPIVQAFRDAWDKFVRFVATLIVMAGWLIPLLALATAAVWIFRRFMHWRPWRDGNPPPPAGPHAGAPGPQPGPPPAAGPGHGPASGPGSPPPQT